MATYFTDFDDQSTTGVFPSGFTARINAEDTWTVQDDSGDKYLYCVDPDSAQYISWDQIDADGDRADCEVLIKYRRVNNVSSLKTRAYGRLSGNSSAFSGYVAGGSTSTLQVYVADSATSWTSLGSVSYTSPAAGVSVWLRLRVVGTTISARMWTDGTEEPSTWSGSGTGWAALSQSNSAVSAAGWVGLGTWTVNAQNYRFDVLGVGTNGDTAPTSGAPPAPTVTLSNLEGYDITSSGFKLRLDYDFA